MDVGLGEQYYYEDYNGDINVLILVLMDVGLGVLIAQVLSIVDVLILVLMDVGLGGHEAALRNGSADVLILVLMDVGLGGQKTQYVDR